jgi:nucleoside-diphosphate-sugar epimerase
MIYITGSSGFLGKHLLASLESKKISFKTASFTNIVKNKKFNYKLLDKIFVDKNIILLHLGWGAMNKPDSFKQFNNFNGSKLLFDYSLKNNFKKVIFIGSIDEYGINHCGALSEKSKTKNINTEYGRQKLKVTNYGLNFFKNSNVEFYSLRPSHIYGHNQRRETIISQLLRRKKNILISNPLGFRDYVYVGDVVKAILLITLNKTKKIETGIYNIGSGKVINVKKFFLLIIKKLKLENNLTNLKSGGGGIKKENKFFLLNHKLKKNFKFGKLLSINHGINKMCKQQKLVG